MSGQVVALRKDPMRKQLSSLAGAGVLVSVSLLAFASPALGIGFGERDNFRHPNVVSLRYVQTDLDAFLSCTGTLIQRDAEKYVFLTAAHCAQAELGGWNAEPAGSGSVGVSFDEVNLPDDTDPTDGGADGVNHVSGGVAIPHPQYRFPGLAGNNDRFDQALVVVPVGATNSLGQTIAERWGGIPGALTPGNLAEVGDVDRLVSDSRDLVFTAVGFGTQSDKSAQGSGEGNKVKRDPDESFLIRNLAQVGFKNLNGFMINVAMNTTHDFGYLCPGDSGGPGIHEDSAGNETILGVLTASNCRSSGAYSRIDFQEVRNFIDCAFEPGDVADVQECVTSRFG